MNTTWISEFGESYNVPHAITFNPKLKDESWHHDACPSFSVVGAGVTALLWVEHENEFMRECDGKRFVVARHTVDPDMPESIDDFVETVLETDDLQEALAALFKTADEERVKYPKLNPITQ